MLDYKQVHLSIEQGLNTLGIFSQRANLHEQIDQAFMHVIVTDINRLLKLDLKERNAIDILIAKELSMIVQSKLVKEDRYYVSVVSSSFLSTENAVVTIASYNCNSTESGEGWYKAKTYVTYNGAGYKQGELLYITTPTITYGEVEKVKIKDLPVILVEPELQQYFSTSTFFSNGLPIVRFTKDKILVEYTRKDGFPVGITYYALFQLPETNRLEWCKKKVIELPTNLQHYYIDLVIAYLAVINKNDQQNIVNLKTETIK